MKLVGDEWQMEMNEVLLKTQTDEQTDSNWGRQWWKTDNAVLVNNTHTPGVIAVESETTHIVMLINSHDDDDDGDDDDDDHDGNDVNDLNDNWMMRSRQWCKDRPAHDQ